MLKYFTTVVRYGYILLGLVFLNWDSHVFIMVLTLETLVTLWLNVLATLYISRPNHAAAYLKIYQFMQFTRKRGLDNKPPTINRFDLFRALIKFAVLGTAVSLGGSYLLLHHLAPTIFTTFTTYIILALTRYLPTAIPLLLLPIIAQIINRLLSGKRLHLHIHQLFRQSFIVTFPLYLFILFESDNLRLNVIPTITIFVGLMFVIDLIQQSGNPLNHTK